MKVESIEAATEATRPPSACRAKVLIIGPSIRIMGGQAVMAERLLRGLRDTGVQADFLPINPLPPGPLRFAENVKYLRTLVVSFFYLASLFRTVPRYDVLHIFSASYMSFMISQAPAIFVGWLFGKKMILNYRSGECDDHLTRWRRTVYPILRRIDRIVVPSDYLKEVFAKHGFEATSVANVVNEASFPFAPRDHFEPKLLVARMLEPLYNVGCSIRAFRLVQDRFPEAELTILGSGPQEVELRALVADLQLQHVEFAGRVSRDQIADVYRNHHVLLNSSSIDNMPVSILEAYSSGLPVVTTDAGGIPFIVRDREIGHLVPVDDHNALGERVIELLENQSATRDMVDAAHDEINRRYRWNVVSQQWIDLYNQLADATAAA